MQTGEARGEGSHGAWMSPREAAEILSVDLDATPADVERAYRRLARVAHPDRLAGASPARVSAASEEFARVAMAHEVMVRQVRGHSPLAQPVVAEAAPTGRWIVLSWLGVIFVAGVISFYGGALPYSTGDVVLRLLPLAAVATAFAFSGRRVFYAATIALLAASVLITLALPTFGSLVALAVLVVPVIGLIVQGRRHAPRARAAS